MPRKTAPMNTKTAPTVNTVNTKMLPTETSAPPAALTKSYLLTILKTAADVDGDVSLFCDDKKHRGVVTLAEDLFVPGFPDPTELTFDNISDFIEDLADYTVSEAHEGTLIRVFNAQGKWFTATNRRLDSMKSKWAAKYETFGHRFTSAIKYIVDDLEECADTDTDTEEGTYRDRMNKIALQNNAFLSEVYARNLDPGCKYVFMLKPSEDERIVCNAEVCPTIYHLGTFDKENKLIDSPVSFDQNVVDKPKHLHFADINALKEAVMALNIKFHQGFVLINKTTGQHYKLWNPTYKYLFFEVRDQVSSLSFRYLQLRAPYEAGKRETFLRLYNYYEQAQKIETDLYKVAQRINKMYHDRNGCDTDEERAWRAACNPVIQILWSEHRKGMHVNPVCINDILIHQQAVLLNKLLKLLNCSRQKKV